MKRRSLGLFTPRLSPQMFNDWWAWHNTTLFETLTREKNERSRKSGVFVTGGRINRVMRLSPLPPPSFRLPSSSLKITLPPLPKAVCTRENAAQIAKQDARQRPDDQLATKTPSRMQTASKITRKTRTGGLHNRRSRSDALEENPSSFHPHTHHYSLWTT